VLNVAAAPFGFGAGRLLGIVSSPAPVAETGACPRPYASPHAKAASATATAVERTLRAALCELCLFITLSS
jgi:hypothetical protein